MRHSGKFVRRPVYEHLTDAEIAERYRTGDSMFNLVVLTGLSDDTIRKVLDAHGVARRRCNSKPARHVSAGTYVRKTP